ncbi:MAG: AI-2E family transporter [Methanoregula sp.]|nr:AI-2E family transporter [Methanoregula sp.]
MGSTEMSHVERSLLVIALIFIIIIAVKETAYMVSLFLMALIITMLASPALFWLKKKGLSDFFATLVITLVAGLVILGFIGLTVLSVNTVISDLPLYQQELNTRLGDIAVMLAPFGLSSLVSDPPALDLGMLSTFGISSAMTIMDTVMFLFFVGVLTFFMLLGAPGMAAHLEGHLGKESHTIQNLARMTGYVTDFIVVRTETNFIHGVLFGGFLGLMGVHGAILWGILTFLLGYIPYFGLLIAAVPALFFAWLQFGVPGAVAVIAAICILNLIVENPVLSYLTARKFEMPALIVLISVIFWGWLLGLVGMLFAVPFTLLFLLLLQMSEELRWINVALGVDHLFSKQDEENVDK